MPPKSKSSVPDWNQCIRCNVVVSQKDLSRHKDECGQAILTHGHVLHGELHGTVVNVSKDFGDKKSVPVNQKDQLVYLHPSVMQLCGLLIGGHCIVQNKYIKLAWPSSNVPSTSVGLSDANIRELGVSKNDLITVETLYENYYRAESVTLATRVGNSMLKEEAVISFVKEKLIGAYVCLDGQVTINYYGQQMLLCVTDVVGTDHWSQVFSIDHNPGPSDTSSLSSSLADLSLSDTSLRESSLTSVHDRSRTGNKTGDTQSLITSTPSKDHSAQDRQDSGETQCIESTPGLVHSTPDRPDSLQHRDGTSPASQDILNTSVKTPTRGRAGIDRDHFCTPKVQRYADRQSNRFYKVTPSTHISVVALDNLGNKTKDRDEETRSSVLYRDIGGLSQQIDSLKEMIHQPLHSPQVFKNYGLAQPRGVLVFGPSGCGKSMLVKAVVSQINVHVVHIYGAELWSKFYGETETKLRNLFQQAIDRCPSIIVIEDLETVCPRRDTSQSELEKRVVSSLLTLMDGISDRKQDKFVLVLATSSKPDLIDPALRRPGRFDREIEIGVPSALDRRDILGKMLGRLQHTLSLSDIASVADSAHGYVGADLAALCNEASLVAMKHHVGDAPVQISMEDLKYALTVVQPSAMREVQLQVPKVLWTDIGGQAEVKLKLKQAVEWPLRHPEAFTRMGISPPKGILMYGPPGCSKTMIAKALATESGLNFLAVKGPELFSKWVGESERAVREVFRKARAAAPAIIFFDEIDALAIERGSSSGSSNVADRVLAQLLTEIDGVEKLRDVTIVAATNRPDMIDKALLRPGRIDRILYVPLPDEGTREEIFSLQLRKMPQSEEVTAHWLARETQGYSGAEITSVCHEAALFALQEDINSMAVRKPHFEQALTVVAPQISSSLIQFYENYHKKCGLQNI